MAEASSACPLDAVPRRPPEPRAARAPRPAPAAERLEPRQLLAASLIKDLVTTPDGSNPGAMLDLNGTLIFGATTPRPVNWPAPGLWKTDGTADGTVRLGAAVNAPPPSNPVVAGNRVFFSPGTYPEQYDVWVTDGTDAGTRRAFTGWAYLAYAGAVDGRLFFGGNPTGYSTELWVSDGTDDGTYLVKDIRPGPDGSHPRALGRTADGSFLFISDDGTHGSELWRSDGTGAGTYLVKDVWPGELSGSNLALGSAELNGRTYFAGDDGAGNRGLWATDGTAAGTVLVRRLGRDGTEAADGADGVPRGFSRVGDTLYFFANDGAYANPGSATGPFNTWLWKSDGTAEGTVRLAPVTPAVEYGPAGPVVDFGNGVAVFATPYKLWRTDGTAEGTSVVREHEQPIDAATVTVSDGVVYYQTAAPNFITRGTVWRSDGTPAGTRALDVTLPDTSFSYFSPRGQVVKSGAAVYFAGEPNGADTGAELVRIPDGSDTPQVIELNPTRPYGSNVTWYTQAGPYAFFLVRQSPNFGPYRLWRTDGTAAGTSEVVDLEYNPFDWAIGSWDPVVVGNSLVFTLGNQVWSVDWETGEHRVLLQSETTYELSRPFANAGKVYFVSGTGLWVSDGVEPAVRLPARPTNGFSSTDSFQAIAGVGDVVYFPGRPEDPRNAQDVELWRSDGTPEGTYLFKDFDPRPNLGSSPEDLVSADGTLYFTDQVSGGPRILWKSDGTPEGTVPVTTAAGVKTYNVSRYRDGSAAVQGNVLYFTGTAVGPDISSFDVELWRTDGTPAGTYRVRDILPGTTGSYPGQLTVAGDKVFFGIGGNLWVSDGTDAGTRQLSTDLHYPFRYEGNYETGPAEMTATPSGMLYFVANDGVRGAELWRSDGTPQGTVIAADLSPIWSGLYNDSTYVKRISQLAAVGETIIFSAYDAQVGFEPWKYRYEGEPTADAGGAYDVADGETVTLSAAASRPGPDGSPIVSYEWDLDYGLRDAFDADATGPTAPFAWRNGPNLMHVAVRVTDAAGRSHVDTAEVRLADRRPEVVEHRVRMAPQQEIVIRFSEDVYLPNVAMTFKNAVTGQTLPFSIYGLSAPGGDVIGAEGAWVPTARLLPGRYRATIPASSVAGLSGGAKMAADYTLEFTVAPTAIVTRGVFYNNSAYDLRGTDDPRLDDRAVAPDKRALRPGQTASIANVTGYAKGINGVVVDLDGPTYELTVGDFEFRAGRGGDPAKWAAAPTPAMVVRSRAGAGGTDRVQFLWPDGALRNTWLRVTVKPTAHTGLVAADVFYFGNLVGETGAGPLSVVSAADLDAARRAVARRGPATIDNQFDFDRDGQLTALDLATAYRAYRSALPPITAAPPALAVASVRRVADDVLS